MGSFPVRREAQDCSAIAMTILQVIHNTVERKIKHREFFFRIIKVFHSLFLLYLFFNRFTFIRLNDFQSIPSHRRLITTIKVHSEYRASFHDSPRHSRRNESTKSVSYFFHFRDLCSTLIFPYRFFESDFFHGLNVNNSNLIEVIYQPEEIQQRIRHMRHHDHQFSLLCDSILSQTTQEDCFITIPNVRDKEGQLIMPNEYETQLKEGAVMIVNVYPQLLVFFYLIIICSNQSF